jgi:hypothetical protein
MDPLQLLRATAKDVLELQLISLQTILNAYTVVEFVNTPALQRE